MPLYVVFKMIFSLEIFLFRKLKVTKKQNRTVVSVCRVTENA